MTAETSTPFLIDCHVDTMLRVVDDAADLGEGIPEGHLDLDRLEKAGVRAVMFSCWPSLDYVPEGSFERAVALAEAVHEQAARHRDRMEVATKVSDVRRIVASGRLAAMLGVEGGHAIEEDLGKLRALAALGVRYMTLTWNNHLSWASSCQKPTDTSPNGLTDFGRRVVQEMHRLGVVADLSHVSPRTFDDVIEMDLPAPFASHVAARARYDHCRNLWDTQIEALASRDGVLGLTLVPGFLGPSANLETAVAHARHIVEVGGPGVLGIGTDFDGIDVGPIDLEDCTRLPALVDGIVTSCGLDRDQQRGVAHGNVLRVFEAWE